jgi:hypothetical protein
MSNFSYCPLTWHFCGEQNTKKIEKNTRTRTSFHLWCIWRLFTIVWSSGSGYLSSIRVSEIIWIAFNYNKILNEKGLFLFIILKISKSTGMELTTNWVQNYDLIWPVQKVHKQLVWRTTIYMQCMPYPTSAASHLKCLLPLFKVLLNRLYRYIQKIT